MKKNATKAEIIDEIIEVNKINAQLIRGIEAVRELINESYGVSGLHLNGDCAEWEELQECGRFEEWLYEFNCAELLINEQKEQTYSHDKFVENANLKQ